MSDKVDFNRAASLMMYGSMLVQDVINSERLQYRKGKDIGSLTQTFRKAFQHGGGKAEIELSWLELYLKDVFKLTKSVEQQEEKD